MARVRLEQAQRYSVFPLLFVLVAVVLAPLLAGADCPFFLAVMAACASIGVIGWSWGVLRHRVDVPRCNWCPLVLPFLCFFPVIFWIVVQPYYFRGDAFSVLEGLIRTGCFLGFLFLAFEVGQQRVWSRRVLWVFVYVTGLCAFYGLWGYFRGNGAFGWFDPWTYGEGLSGAFVNRNAFAAFIGMGVLAAVAVFLDSVQRAIVRARMTCLPTCLYEGMSDFRMFFVIGARVPRLLRWRDQGVLLCAVAMIVALVLSGAAVGMAGVLVGAVVLWGGMMASGLLDRRVLAGIALLVVSLVCFALVVWGQGGLSQVHGGDLIQDERVKIWAMTVDMIRDAPVTGQGYNQYSDLFAKYRTPDLSHHSMSAHSVYLEMVAELGLPAAAVWFSSCVFVFVQLLRGLCCRRGRDALFPALGLAVLVQAGVQSLVDSGFLVLTNEVVFFVLLGMALAQSGELPSPDQGDDEAASPAAGG